MTSSYRDSYESGGGPQFQYRLPTLTSFVRLLLIANGIVFVAQWLTLMIGGEGADSWVIQVFGLNPGAWDAWFPLVPIWQPITSGFMHGDPMHLFWNMVLLYFFGTMLEGIVGARRFLVVYVAAMLSGAVAHLVSEWVMGDPTPAIGASGAVLGVLVACAVLRPNAQVLVLFIPVRLKWVAIFLVVIDFYFASTGRGTRTAHFDHLGGAAFGFLAARLGWIWKDPVESLQRRREERAREQGKADDVRMDELLEKIHREGMNSLDRREKEFLKRMSKRS